MSFKIPDNIYNDEELHKCIRRYNLNNPKDMTPYFSIEPTRPKNIMVCPLINNMGFLLWDLDR